MELSSNDNKLESYLRNELPDSEVAALEDELLRDDELYQRLETLQMNLIDSYLENEMSDDEKRRFEVTFLSIPANQLKLEEAQVFRESLRLLREKQPAPQKVVRFPIRFIELAAAAVLLIGIVLIIVLFAISWRSQNNLSAENDHRSIPVINRIPPPLSSPTPTPVTTPPKQKPGSFTREKWLFLRESRTGVAGPDDDVPIEISPNTRILILRHELLDDAHALSVLHLSIKDQMGYPVLGPLELPPVRLRYNGHLRRAISVDVPVSTLKPGERYRFDIAELPPPKTFVITR
ncbi:MAG TPA: hypothetical protein VJT15_03015 [Pyrinomonadaceae bacterium]|nr:hypothetical protein [Pyrinomonadaceae bacterium]